MAQLVNEIAPANALRSLVERDHKLPVHYPGQVLETLLRRLSLTDIYSHQMWRTA